MYFILIDGAYILMASTLAVLCADTDADADTLSNAVAFYTRPAVGTDRPTVTVEYIHGGLPVDGRFIVMGSVGEVFIKKTMAA